MGQRTQVMVAGATFVAAWSIGFLMEDGGASATRLQVDDVDLSQVLQQIDAHPNRVEVLPVVPPPVRPDRTEAAAPVDCSLQFSASPIDGGRALLSLAAPCAGDTVATITHGALMFTVPVVDGAWAKEVPALSDMATYTVTLGDHGAVASTLIRGAAEIDRAVLQWDGPAGFALRASGSVTRLGAPGGLQAMVYDMPRQGADVAVEVEVAPHTCGQVLAAEFRAADEVVPIQVTLPACDGVEGYLVLKNLKVEPKLAAL